MTSNGKVVAITGASSGVGEATARYLAARGASVVLGARSEDKLCRIVDEIETAGGHADYMAMDVADRGENAALVELAAARFGRLDAFVANAGAMSIGPMDDLATDDWEYMVEVNIKGVLWGIAAALPMFREQQSGHFIAVASTAARNVVPNMAVYAGTKAAVAAICEGLRQEVAGELRVSTVFPGYTATNFAGHVRDGRIRAQLEASGSIAMPAAAVASAIAYAIEQPDGVDVGEIVIRPTAQA